jgi:5'-nucleotidase
MSSFSRIAAAIIAGLLFVVLVSQLRPRTVDLTILAINDFHGNLKPPAGGISVLDPKDRGKHVSVAAGGAEHLATAVAQLKANKANNIFVAAGDLIGASPLLSALFNDEPTVEALSMMGLAISAVGNHEFDDGKDELLRMQNGGCHPLKGCKGPKPFTGAKFKYLAASTVVTDTGKTLLPAYEVREFGGIKVAFIGLTLKGTPGVVTPSGVAGLAFRDEAETVNGLVPELRAKGIEAIVLLIHEGGFPSGDYNECPGISGPIVEIVNKLDRAVDLVVSGHTHKAYNCTINGRLVTSGDKFGTILTEINVKLDARTRDFISAKANNHIVRVETYAKAPEQTALIEAYDKLARPLAERVVGSLTDTLSRTEAPTGESALGQVVADAQLAATRAPEAGGALFAVTNTGGIRTDIRKQGDGVVTFGDVFAAQPFGNNLVTGTITGAQIKLMLEQQWLNQPKPRILQVSKGFSYTWDDRRPKGDFVPAESIMLNGVPVDPAARYRLTANAFLMDGGDGFLVLKDAMDRKGGPPEVQALEAWFKTHSPLAPGALDRIKRAE